MAAQFDLEGLKAELEATPFGGRVRFFSTIGSTNALAMAEASAGAEHGNVYLADEQTAGRGRASHTWHSEPETGLYFSVLLRPQLAPAEALWLSLAAGVAVYEAVQETCGIASDIRWPNDLLLGSRKYGGILTELNAEATRVRFAVIGIGLNVNHTAFPEELAADATSLRIETGREWSRQHILQALLKALQRETEALASAGSQPLQRLSAQQNLLRRIERYSTWIRGKRVRVEEDGGYTGTTDGLDERGFLRVNTSSGARTVLSGGVRALPHIGEI